MFLLSKPLRLRGLKFRKSGYRHGSPSVEAFAASWIEINYMRFRNTQYNVEAFAASWIEIDPASKRRFSEYVEAFAASWIEIY